MELKGKKHVKVENENNERMNEMFGNLSEDEAVFGYFRSDALMSFNGENEEDDNAWKAMNKRGYQMDEDADNASVKIKKLLGKLVIEMLERTPMSIHDISGEIMYGRRKNDVCKISREYVEKVLFFNVLPELEKISMIKMSEAMILGGGTETIYYM